jgi:hypothetical protein
LIFIQGIGWIYELAYEAASATCAPDRRARLALGGADTGARLAARHVRPARAGLA